MWQCVLVAGRPLQHAEPIQAVTPGLTQLWAQTITVTFDGSNNKGKGGASALMWQGGCAGPTAHITQHIDKCGSALHANWQALWQAKLPFN